MAEAALNRLDRVLRERDFARTVLREVEWSGITWGLGYKCPSCGGLQTKQEGYPVGHKRGCRLVKALGGDDGARG